MADEHSSPIDDRLRTTLGTAAEGVTVEPTAPGGFAAAGAARRRRRRGLLAGGTAAALIGVVGLVIVNGDDPSTISTSDEAETSAPITDGEPTEVGTTVPDDASDDASSDQAAITAPEITTPPTLAPSDTASDPSFSSSTKISAPLGDQLQLLPWSDGFLSIGIEYAAQPLLPLTEQQQALFPPEMFDVFPDGLPGTVQEATDALQAAGLLDQVTTILSDNPEVRDIILGQPTPPPTVRANYTTDGVEWTSVEVDLPAGFQQFVVAGDRLVAWSIDENDGMSNAPFRTVTVSSTTDLVNWDTSATEVAVDVGDQPDYVRADIWLSSFAATADRWMATVTQNTWVDWDLVLPESTSDMEFGGGWSTDDTGISVDRYAEDGSSSSTFYTWAELGLESNPEYDEGSNETSLLTGDFTGTTQRMDMPEGSDYGNVQPLGDRFLLSTDILLTSADGTTWIPFEGLPEGSYVSAGAPVAGGTLLITEDNNGGAKQAWIYADDGALSPATLPELPDGYSLWGAQPSATWVVELSSAEEENWEPITVEIDYEGLLLALTDGPDGQSYTLSDTATGEEIQSVASVGYDDSMWEFDEESGQGYLVITDLDTGEELLRIPEDVLTEAYNSAYEGSGATDVTAEDWSPDLWVIATSNGVDWVTHDLAETTGEDGGYVGWPLWSAINGDRLLYHTVDGWVLETI